MASPRNRGDACLVYTTIQEMDRHKRFRLGLPIRRKSRKIPWGYIESEDDVMILEPVDKMFEMLVEAKKQLNNVSYKAIADWLVDRTGVPITCWGVPKLLENRSPFDEAALPREEREKFLETPL